VGYYNILRVGTGNIPPLASAPRKNLNITLYIETDYSKRKEGECYIW
jgi:hypothetical protein